MISKQFFIYGRVQGVGFRYFTWKKTSQIGIVGYVKNMSDGSVQVIAKGNLEQLTQFRNWLQQGPKTAHVTQVLEQDCTIDIMSDRFLIRR